MVTCREILAIPEILGPLVPREKQEFPAHLVSELLESKEDLACLVLLDKRESLVDLETQAWLDPPESRGFRD